MSMYVFIHAYSRVEGGGASSVRPPRTKVMIIADVSKCTNGMCDLPTNSVNVLLVLSN